MQTIKVCQIPYTAESLWKYFQKVALSAHKVALNLRFVDNDVNENLFDMRYVGMIGRNVLLHVIHSTTLVQLVTCSPVVSGTD